MRRLFALAIGALVSAGIMACGDSSRSSGPASRTSSEAAITGKIFPTASTSTGAARRMFGDYDDDDYYDDASHGDGDNDDGDSRKDGDNDSDSSGNSYYDSDDISVRDFGHAARPGDRQAIVRLVKSYYRTAVAGDGARACALISAPLGRTFPQVLGGNGPHYLHGSKTCVEVASRLFRQNHLQLSAYAVRLNVAGVRLNGDLGLVVLDFKTLPGRQIEVIREHGAWKMYAPLDNELP